MAAIPLPSFLDAAERAAASGQRSYLLAIRMRLAALVVAAVGGALSVYLDGVDVFAWVALVGFVAAVLIELYVFAATPDRLWYEGRAAAESIKTLAWRFAVGGAPFPAALPADEAAAALRARLVEVSHDLQHESIPPTTTGAGLVPAELVAVRAGSFEERKAIYARDRIDDQHAWYGGRAARNARRSRQFLLATLVLEFVGVVAAVLRASGIIGIDLLGIAAAVVSGVAAWAQTRQYGSLSSAYSIAARELTVVADELTVCGEKDWADFVGRAEDAISREHTLWRSTHGSVDTRIRQ